MRQGFVLCVLALIALITMGAGEGGCTRAEVAIIPTVQPQEPPLLFEVVLRPANKGSMRLVQGIDGRYSFSSISSEDARTVLPVGYRLPQRISIKDLKESRDFQLLVGPGELPVPPERVVRMPLSEEVRVPIRQDGLIQLLFEGEIPCKQ